MLAARGENGELSFKACRVWVLGDERELLNAGAYGGTRIPIHLMSLNFNSKMVIILLYDVYVHIYMYVCITTAFKTGENPTWYHVSSTS